MGIIITQEVRKESRTWNGLTWLLLPFLVPSVLIHEALIQEKEKKNRLVPANYMVKIQI